MPRGGRLCISARNVTVSEALAKSNPGARSGPHVLITVMDTGSGIPPELINRVFDPFFTIKVAGKGTGLGLSTAMGIMKGHGGFLQVQSEAGRGTEFSLYFPAVLTEAEGVVSTGVTDLPRGHGETVLVIDDGPAVRAVVHALLKAHGYNSLMAADGPSGLVLFREHQSIVKAVITDMMMPGIQGAGGYSRIVGHQARLPRGGEEWSGQ